MKKFSKITYFHQSNLDEKRNWSYVLTGILLFEIFNILFSIFSFPTLRIFQLFGLIILSLGIIKVKKSANENAYLIVFVRLFLIWNLIASIRMYELSLEELRRVFFQPIHLLAYLVPLVCFFKYSGIFLKALIDFTKIVAFVYICLYCYLAIFMFKDNSNFIQDLITAPFISAVGFLFLTWQYHQTRTNYLSLLTLLMMVFAGAIAGRRNIILTASALLGFGSVIILFFNKNLITKKLSIALIFPLIFAIGYLNISAFNNNFFEVLSNRVDVDSRSEVFLFFFNDLKGTDWIIGKGIDGTYYNPTNYWNLTNEESREVIYRDNIENGYLFIILKEGLVGLILFLMIILPAIYLSIFKSNNNFTKAFGFIAFSYLIDMSIFGQPAFSVKYFLLWFSITLSYSKILRNKSEEEIIKLLRNG